MSGGLQIFVMYLILILMLLFTISIHEIGHFVVGYFCKVNVKEISIGVGPKLWGWTTKNKMEINIKCIPLVAYVLFDSKKLRQIYENEQDDPKYLWYMSPVPQGKTLLEETKTWQYLLIMVAGVAFNLAAFFILWPITWAVCKYGLGTSINPFVDLGKTLEAIGCCLVFKGGDASNIFVQIPDLEGNPVWGYAFLDLFLMMNLLTFIFNLIPIPPLDGWKIVERAYTCKTHKEIKEKTLDRLTYIGIGIMGYIFLTSILVKWIHW